MTRLTDYGVMLLTYFAREGAQKVHSARELAQHTHLPQPTVSKILKTLAHNDLVTAHRGVKGGFSLARDPRNITVADVVAALEGPISMTECSAHPGQCGVEPQCPVGSNWRRINQVVLNALKQISLADMAHPITFVQRRGALELQRSL